MSFVDPLSHVGEVLRSFDTVDKVSRYQSLGKHCHGILTH